eukprot:758819-Hanusia_phi.AAC.6
MIPHVVPEPRRHDLEEVGLDAPLRLTQLQEQQRALLQLRHRSLVGRQPGPQALLQQEKNLRGFGLYGLEGRDMPVGFEHRQRRPPVLDRLCPSVELHRPLEAGGELEDEGELLEQPPDAVQPLNPDPSLGEVCVDLGRGLGDLRHLGRQPLHLPIHPVHLVLHRPDSLCGADELVVVLVHQHLHVTVELLDL